jgi:hypothetical protein
MDKLKIRRSHLGKAPEMKYTSQGTSITTFPVAANYFYAKPNAEPQPSMAGSVKRPIWRCGRKI